MKTLLVALLCLVSIGFAGYFGVRLVAQAIALNEIVSCQKLEQFATEGYRVFYITSWQKDMCDAHEIFINAPVKDSE